MGPKVRWQNLANRQHGAVDRGAASRQPSAVLCLVQDQRALMATPTAVGILNMDKIS